MADNPRNPEHYSDVPSSRHSGGGPNQASPATGSSYIPPHHPSGAVPPAKTHLRNVLIGAVVTIFTSTVVFLITQYLKKPEGSEFERKKNATVATWKSYVAYENAYFQNLLSYQSTLFTEGRDAFLKAMKTESDKFIKDISDLRKRKNLDEDLVKTFNKRVENEINQIPPLEDYFKRLTAIENSNQSIKEKKDNITGEMIRFVNIINNMYDRALNDMKEIVKVLAERYGSTFNMDDFLLVQKSPQLMKTNDSLIRILQNVILDSSGNVIENRNFARNIDPNNLVGKWAVPDAIIILTKEGNMSWTLNNGMKAEGKWKILNDKLEMNVSTTEKKKAHWRFNLVNITSNSFIMMLDTLPYNYYKLTRTLEN
jgi:hypothetical protein